MNGGASARQVLLTTGTEQCRLGWLLPPSFMPAACRAGAVHRSCWGFGSFPVVALGGSAGFFTAFEYFFRYMRPESANPAPCPTAPYEAVS